MDTTSHLSAPAGTFSCWCQTLGGVALMAFPSLVVAYHVLTGALAFLSLAGGAVIAVHGVSRILRHRRITGRW